jgi:hypothetical protein
VSLSTSFHVSSSHKIGLPFAGIILVYPLETLNLGLFIFDLHRRKKNAYITDFIYFDIYLFFYNS